MPKYKVTIVRRHLIATEYFDVDAKDAKSAIEAAKSYPWRYVHDVISRDKGVVTTITVRKS